MTDAPSAEAGDLLAIDFDGTLTEGEARYWEDELEQPRGAVSDWVRDQYYSGAHIIIWTARPWSQAGRIAARLTEWGVPYHGIRCEKGGAELYVDDKAIPAAAIDPEAAGATGWGETDSEPQSEGEGEARANPEGAADLDTEGEGDSESERDGEGDGGAEADDPFPELEGDSESADPDS